jgi:predicted amidohydrolase YtcJ
LAFENASGGEGGVRRYNEVGKKRRIETGQLADLIVPDRDYFTCAEAEIAAQCPS